MDASHVQGIHRMSVMSFVGKGRYVSVFVLLLFENIHSHIIDCGVVKYNDTTIWAGLDVYAAVFAEIVVAAAAIVAYGLDSDVELVGDAVHRTVGQTVFEFAQIVETDGLSHDGIG